MRLLVFSLSAVAAMNRTMLPGSLVLPLADVFMLIAEAVVCMVLTIAASK